MLADKGVEWSLTEIEIMGEIVEGIQDGRITPEQLEKLANGGELSEEELEEAAGGNDLWGVLDTAWDAFTKIKNGLNPAAEKQLGGNIVKASLEANRDAAGVAGYVGQTASTAAASGGVSGMMIGGIIAGTVALGGLGYGVYSAVRRRW